MRKQYKRGLSWRAALIRRCAPIFCNLILMVSSLTYKSVWTVASRPRPWRLVLLSISTRFSSLSFSRKISCWPLVTGALHLIWRYSGDPLPSPFCFNGLVDAKYSTCFWLKYLMTCNSINGEDMQLKSTAHTIAAYILALKRPSPRANAAIINELYIGRYNLRRNEISNKTQVWMKSSTSSRINLQFPSARHGQSRYNAITKKGVVSGTFLDILKLWNIECQGKLGKYTYV